jgi:flagellar basal body-associated protein FliL
VQSALEGNFTFDVMVLSPKMGWVSVARMESADQARREAKKLVDSDRHEGVKITQEHYDYLENKFVDKTIFLRTRSGSKMPEPSSEPDDDYFDDDDYYDEDEEDGGNYLLMGIAGIVVCLMIIVAAGLLFLKDSHDYKSDYEAGSSSAMFRYDLPTIMTNFTKNGRNYSLQMSLQMELYRPEHVRNIEENLAPVMEAVITHLQEMDPEDLNNSGRLQYLRAMLRHRVKEVIGDADFNDILFKDIQVRIN